MLDELEDGLIERLKSEIIMILVDLNQVMISNLMMHIQGASSVDKGTCTYTWCSTVCVCTIRSSVASMAIWSYVVMIRTTGVKKCLHTTKQVARVKKSQYDWNEIFTALNNIRDEIRENTCLQSYTSRTCRSR